MAKKKKGGNPRTWIAVKRRIKAARTALGLTQERAAEQWGISVRKLRDLEKGRGASIDILQRLVKTSLGKKLGANSWLDLLTKEERKRASLKPSPLPAVARAPDVFGFLDQRLTAVSYLKLSPPIDVTEHDPPNFCRIRPEKFRIPPPPPPALRSIIRDVVMREDGLQPDTDQFRRRAREYHVRAKDAGFAERADYNLKEDTPEYRVFSRLLKDEATFQAACRQELEDYLTRSNGFHFNGQFLAAYRFKETREQSEDPSLLVELQLSDYYTYRVIGRLRQLLGEDFWCGVGPRAGPNLTEYLASRFQRNIHTGVGLDMVVGTLRDKRLIITRRSANTGNRAGEAGKYFESVCEGLNQKDLNPNDSRRLQPLSQVIRRALNEELIGDHGGGLDLLNKKISQCFVTGAFMYLPDLSINLCVAVLIDCSAEDVRRASVSARDSRFESAIINEPRWHGSSGLPEFSPKGIDQFARATLENRNVADVWHEGSLVTLMLSTLATPQMR